MDGECRSLDSGPALANICLEFVPTPRSCTAVSKSYLAPSVPNGAHGESLLLDRRSPPPGPSLASPDPTSRPALPSHAGSAGRSPRPGDADGQYPGRLNRRIAIEP